MRHSLPQGLTSHVKVEQTAQVRVSFSRLYIARETNSVLSCTTVCESCCQANGECVDGECQCRAEFEGNDCGEFL